MRAALPPHAHPKSGSSAWTSFRNLGPVKRYTLYIVPLAVVLAIPIFAAFLRDEKNSDGSPRNTIGGTDEKRFWIMIEAVWLSLWICTAVTYFVPKVVKFFRPKTSHDVLLQELRNPISWSLWMVLNQFTFAVFINTDRAWKHTMQSVFKALMMIRLSCDRRVSRKSQDADRNIEILSRLYHTTNPILKHDNNISAGPNRTRNEFRDAEPATEAGGFQLAKAKVVTALKSPDSAEELAQEIYRALVRREKDPASSSLPSQLQLILDLRGKDTVSEKDMVRAVTKIRKMSVTARGGDVNKAINELNSLLTIATCILCIIIFTMFLSPNLLGALATSATALLSLSFVFATTCQEVLGSCVFLFVKHPYDVGDHVSIKASELVVERISLLYTVFTQLQTANVVQTPNIVLNSVWVENVSRSETVREQISTFVAFDTDFDDIKRLQIDVQAKMKKASSTTLQGPDPEVELEIVSASEMDKLELRCTMHYEKPQSNDALRATRRSELMHALVTALRESPIRRPQGCDAALLSTTLQSTEGSGGR